MPRATDDDSRTGHAQAHAIAELFDRVGRFAHALGFSDGLNPAQWSALRFFLRANESARTVTGFARANGITHGTATQTVAALVRKGYLSRLPNPRDRRSTRLDLTDAGSSLLKRDPLYAITALIEGIPRHRAVALAGELEQIIRQLESRAGRTARHTSPAA